MIMKFNKKRGLPAQAGQSPLFVVFAIDLD